MYLDSYFSSKNLLENKMGISKALIKTPISQSRWSVNSIMLRLRSFQKKKIAMSALNALSRQRNFYILTRATNKRWMISRE